MGNFTRDYVPAGRGTLFFCRVAFFCEIAKRKDKKIEAIRIPFFISSTISFPERTEWVCVQ